MIAQIRNGRFQVQAVWGQQGFTITSLQDLLFQKEWLYTENSFSQVRRNDKTFDSQYEGGMEFLFPSDEAEVFEEKAYQDHGVLWRTPYQVNTEGSKLLAEGFHEDTKVKSVYDVELKEEAVLLKVTIYNLSANELPYLARLHPAFLLEKDTRLLVHGERVFFEPDGAYCSFSPEEAKQMNMEKPASWQNNDLFVHIKQNCGEFEIHQNDRKIKVIYEKNKLPFLTICSFLKGGKRIGILEPANMPGINLKSAARTGKIPILLPGDSVEYQFKIILT